MGPQAERLQEFQGRFSPGVRNVLVRSKKDAIKLGHNYIGTEHFLLGLLGAGEEDLARQTLNNLGVDMQRALSAVEFIIGRGERPITEDIRPTPRARKVLELSDEERRRLGATEIGTNHLLLSIVREGEGIAAGVLENLGVGLERIRQEEANLRIARQLRQVDEAQAKSSKLSVEDEAVNRLREVLSNPNISQRSRTFLMGMVEHLTSFAQQEDPNHPPTP